MSRSTPKLLSCSTRAELATVLDTKPSTLTYYAYGRGRRYKQFEIPKKSGGSRVINAPVAGLNNIQKKLAILLEEVYRPHPAAHGFIRKKSVLSNASGHITRKCVLNIDLKDFFPSITGTRIMGLLKSEGLGLNSEVASTIAALCTHNGRLPQGAATSPIISNMIAYRLDKELTKLSKAHRVRYTRYVDDITFSTTKAKLDESFIKYAEEGHIVLGDVLTSVINANYFEINQSKVRLQDGRKSKYVTGIKVNTKPNLSLTFIRELRSMIHAWERHGLNNAQKYFNEKYQGNEKSYTSVVTGKLAYLKQVKGKDDLVYLRLHNRLLTLQSKFDEIAPIGEIETICRKIFVIQSGAYGTGFILDGKWLITCAHVLQSNKTTFFPSEKSALPEYHLAIEPKKEWISAVNEYDIAALPLPKAIANDTNILKSAPINTTVKLGDECKVVGFPAYYLGSTPSIVEGKVIKVERNKYGIEDAYFDRVLVTGNSGGPVLNSNNQVIGIVRTGAPDSEDAQGYGSTFLPIQEMRRCLSQFN